jgi:hypothetical protein
MHSENSTEVRLSYRSASITASMSRAALRSDAMNAHMRERPVLFVDVE